jgi:protein tyrosine/serine phosphatase
MKFGSLRNAIATIVAVHVLGFAALAGTPGAADSMGPTNLPGISIDNFGVVDGHIYRGAKPGKSGYAELAAFGIKEVIDLRGEAKSGDRQLAEAAGLKYVSIPMEDHSTPTDDESAAFLKAVGEANGDKVYVHCAGGRHRTGSMIAVYRMVQDGWTIDQAYDEMLKYDFYTSNGHGGYKTYVEDFFRRKTANPTSVPAAYHAPDAAVAVSAAATN